MKEQLRHLTFLNARFDERNACPPVLKLVYLIKENYILI